MSKKEKKYPNKTKIHTQYFNSSGVLVPGVTTISGMYPDGDKGNILIKWAKKLQLLGIDSQKYTDYTCEVGSCLHEMVCNDLQGASIKENEVSKEVYEHAKMIFDNDFVPFKASNKLEPIIQEVPLVSNKFNFGGTLDYFGKINEELTLNDWKTSSGIYDSYWVQLAGLEILLEENGYKQEHQPITWQITRFDKEGGLEIKRLDKILGADYKSIYRMIFQRLLDIYHLKNKIEFLRYKA